MRTAPLLPVMKLNLRIACMQFVSGLAERSPLFLTAFIIILRLVLPPYGRWRVGCDKNEELLAPFQLLYPAARRRPLLPPFLFFFLFFFFHC